jgi:malonyl-CoA decarboxylase
VVEELRRELPKLDTFITLSPVPGFMQWLKQADDVPVSDEERTLLENLDKPDWFENAELTAQLRAVSSRWRRIISSRPARRKAG